jgi:hypothetical protein
LLAIKQIAHSFPLVDAVELVRDNASNFGGDLGLTAGLASGMGILRKSFGCGSRKLSRFCGMRDPSKFLLLLDAAAEGAAEGASEMEEIKEPSLRACAFLFAGVSNF